jgi:copper type II ascorbate-dependent monooxygenase-like protein
VGRALSLLVLPAGASALTLRTHLRRPRRGLQVRLDPITVAPGSEREVCQLVTLPNRRPMNAREISIAMPSGATYTSHHFAIFLFEGESTAAIPSGPFDRVGCAGVGDTIVSPILAFVQRHRQDIRFPAGVAVALAPHQRLLLNSHYINGGTEPVTIDVATNFHAAPKRSVRHHARSFQLGTFRIDVPPGESASASASWTTPFPMNVVWLSTHSHKHTTSVDVDVLRGGVPGPLELETRTYSEPTVNLYPSPLRLASGDGFHWTCNYRNDTSRRITFGVTSNDEMCFTVGFFYPDDDTAPLPSVPGCFGKGAGLVCPGN